MGWTFSRAKIIASVLALGTVAGCHSSSESRSPLPPGLFRITASGRDGAGAGRYRVFDDGRCAFSITIGPDASGAPFAFGNAVFEREAQADCTRFLQALAPTLGFKGALPAAAPVDQLLVGITILGTSQSRVSGNPDLPSSFASDPPGPWLVTKLFLADGEGEVYLNLDVRDGRGEFSYKDEDYASVVVSELARVLLPRK